MPRDLVVYKCKYKSEAEDNKGLWFFVKYKSEAKKKLFFVNYKSEADIVIYFYYCPLKLFDSTKN